MAEVELPPIQPEPELPEEQLPQVEKPTEKSKVISVDFNPLNTKQTTSLDTRESFFTTDTDAWIVLNVGDMNEPTGQYSLALINKEDGSIFQRTGDIVQGVAYYKLLPNEIKHAGRWVGQAVITLGNGQTTASRFSFNVSGHILDGKDVREIVIQDFQTLMAQLNDLKDNSTNEFGLLKNEIEAFQIIVQENEDERQATELGRVAAEIRREENYESKVTAAIVEADVVEKVDNKVAELAPTIQQVTAQLALKANESEVIKKSEGVGLNDAKPDLLGALSDAPGVPFNLLSIPRPNSVTNDKISPDAFSFDGYQVKDTVSIIKFAFNVSEIAIVNEQFSFNLDLLINSLSNISKTDLRILGSTTEIGGGDFIVNRTTEFISTPNDLQNINYLTASTKEYNYIQIWLTIYRLDTGLPFEINFKNAFLNVLNQNLTPSIIFGSTKVVKIEELPYQLASVGKVDDKIEERFSELESEIIPFVSEPINMLNPSLIKPTYPDPYVKAEKILIEEGKTYHSGNGLNISFYDAVLVKVTNSQTSSKFTVDSGKGIKYVDITWASNTPQRMLILGDFYPTEYIPYTEKKMKSNFKIDHLNILDKYLYPVLKRRWQDKIWSALGDSITNYVGATNNYLKQASKIMLTSQANNFGVNNSKISGSSTTYPPFTQRYTSIPTDSDLITVFGGINDFYLGSLLGTIEDNTIDTFYGALKVLCEGLLNNYPNARIAFFTPVKSFSRTHKSVSGYSEIEYIKAIKEVCGYYSIPVLDLFSNAGIDATIPSHGIYFAGDGSGGVDELHPSETGHTRMTNLIVNFLESI